MLDYCDWKDKKKQTKNQTNALYIHLHHPYKDKWQIGLFHFFKIHSREVQASKPQFTPNIHTSLPNNQMCAIRSTSMVEPHRST